MFVLLFALVVEKKSQIDKDNDYFHVTFYSFIFSTDLTPFKCLGHLYINEENPDVQSISSFIFLPINSETTNYTFGDILVSNRSSLNVESVVEIVAEQDAIFIHTELADCSDSTTYMNGYVNSWHCAGEMFV